MSLGFHSGKWRGTELIAEDNLFSFILGASQGAPRKTCAKVLKQVFHFLKNPFRWRVGMPSWNADKIFLALRAHDLYPVRSVSLAGDEGVSAA